LEGRDNLFEDDLKDAKNLLDDLIKNTEQSNQEWLLENTEKWCQEKAIFLGIQECINILDESNKKQTKTKGAIPQILSEALSVSFDPNIGHDYIEDAESRFEFYHRIENRIPFDLDYFNRITNGGLAPKTLSVILAGTNVGKSLAMCHMAAAALAQNFNVLYITLEMAQEKIASRIDANLLDTPLDLLLKLPKITYDKKIENLRSRVKGKLIIKEYPTASASVINFRNLLIELKLKKQFKPDLIVIDYLNICCSARLKMGATINSYTYVKAIAEEIRGLAQEYAVPILSATQTNRSGSTDSDPDMTSTGESFGLPQTVDNLWAMINNEDFEAMRRIMFKQLKNRDNDVTKYKRFLVGIDRSRMKLFDVDDSEQNNLVDDSQTPEAIYSSIGKNNSSSNKSLFK